MKRFIIILSALAMAGCTINRQNLHDPDVTMVFQPGMYMHVADDDAERYPENQSFGISAWSLPDGSSWSSSRNKATEYISGFKAEPLDELRWTCGEDLLWPSVADNLTFLAWSPYGSADKCDKQNGISFRIEDIFREQTDILYTDPLQDRCKLECGGVVTIPFRHALSQVSVSVKNRVADNEKITLKSIEIDRTAVSGTFKSLRAEQWETGSEYGPAIFFEGEHLTGAHPEPVGRTWLMIPQEIETSLTVTYDFTTVSGETITQRLKTIPLKMRLEAGRSYNLTLSIGIDDVKFLKEIIKDRFEK